MVFKTLLFSVIKFSSAHRTGAENSINDFTFFTSLWMWLPELNLNLLGKTCQSPFGCIFGLKFNFQKIHTYGLRGCILSVVPKGKLFDYFYLPGGFSRIFYDYWKKNPELWEKSYLIRLVLRNRTGFNI